MRWVIVDDTDPRIEYVGPWYNGSSQTNDFGDFGPLFQGTVHGVDSQHLANISYMFTGQLYLNPNFFSFCLTTSAQVPESELLEQLIY